MIERRGWFNLKRSWSSDKPCVGHFWTRTACGRARTDRNAASAGELRRKRVVHTPVRQVNLPVAAPSEASIVGNQQQSGSGPPP